MLYLYDKTEKLIAILPKGSFFDPIHREVLNGENTFSFSYPANQSEAEHIAEGNLVAFKDLDSYWQVFEIKKIVDLHSDGLTRTAYCEHIFYELLDDIVTDKRPSGTAHAALEAMLEGTRWEVGIVDDLGVARTNAYYESALSAVQKVANAWKGELRWRCVVEGGVIIRVVDLLAMRGTDTGKQFAYAKDILNIKREVDISGLTTALYGRGKGVETESGGYGRRLTFADVEWSVENGDPVDKPLGQEWVGDPEALERWGRPGSTGKRHRFDVFVDEDEEDPEALLQKTWEQLQQRKIPRVTYELDVISLEQLTGYKHEQVRLGDLVRVIDREFNPPLVVSARVIEIERDLLAPENTKVVLGSFAPSIVEAQINTDRKVEDLVNRPYNTKWLDGKINVLQNAIENTSAYIWETPQGTLHLNAPTYEEATEAMLLGGGRFAIANQKDGQGGWEWRTFGDGAGFTADEITTGKLIADVVHIGAGTTFDYGYDPSEKETPEGAQAKANAAKSAAIDYADLAANSVIIKSSTEPEMVVCEYSRDSVAYHPDTGEEIPEDTPVFVDFAGGKKGSLMVEGTTNLLLYSEDFTQSVWAKTRVNVSSAGTYLGYHVTRFTPNNPGQYSAVSQTFLASGAANRTFTWSFWARGQTNRQFHVNFFGGTFVAYAINLTTEWQKFTITHTFPSIATSARIQWGNSRPYWGTEYTDWIEVAGVQVEEKPYATSFIDGTRANPLMQITLPEALPDTFAIGIAAKMLHAHNKATRTFWECGDYRCYFDSSDNKLKMTNGVVTAETATVTWGANDYVGVYAGRENGNLFIQAKIAGVVGDKAEQAGDAIGSGTTLYVGSRTDGSESSNAVLADFVLHDRPEDIDPEGYLSAIPGGGEE